MDRAQLPHRPTPARRAQAKPLQTREWSAPPRYAPTRRRGAIRPPGDRLDRHRSFPLGVAVHLRSSSGAHLSPDSQHPRRTSTACSSARSAASGSRPDRGPRPGRLRRIWLLFEIAPETAQAVKSPTGFRRRGSELDDWNRAGTESVQVVDPPGPAAVSDGPPSDPFFFLLLDKPKAKRTAITTRSTLCSAAATSESPTRTVRCAQLVTSPSYLISKRRARRRHSRSLHTHHPSAYLYKLFNLLHHLPLRTKDPRHLNPSRSPPASARRSRTPCPHRPVRLRTGTDDVFAVSCVVFDFDGGQSASGRTAVFCGWRQRGRVQRGRGVRDREERNVEGSCGRWSG